MRSFNIRQSIPANATIPDVIQQQGINAYFGKAAAFALYWGCDTVANMFASLGSDDGISGKNMVPFGSTVPTLSTPGLCKTSENFIGQFAVDAGSKLLMAVTNPTGAALIFNALVVVN